MCGRSQCYVALGAQIGGAVSTQFGGLKMRASYGGLRTFVQTHCQGQVIRVGEKNGDDLYQFAGSEPATPTLPGELAKSASTHTAWDAFQRPKVEAKLTVNTETGELRVTDPSVPVQDSWREVSPLTLQEHREIAALFLPKVQEEDRATFSEALEGENYWVRWANQLHTIGGGKYKLEWGAYRFAEVCRIFKDRLRTHAMSDELAAAALDHLKASQKRKIVKFASAALVSSTSIPANRPSTGSLHLKDLIKTAIDLMGENELRQVWLPVGEVFDALRIKRP